MCYYLKNNIIINKNKEIIMSARSCTAVGGATPSPLESGRGRGGLSGPLQRTAKRVKNLVARGGKGKLEAPDSTADHSSSPIQRLYDSCLEDLSKNQYTSLERKLFDLPYDEFISLLTIHDDSNPSLLYRAIQKRLVINDSELEELILKILDQINSSDLVELLKIRDNEDHTILFPAIGFMDSDRMRPGEDKKKILISLINKIPPGSLVDIMKTRFKDDYCLERVIKHNLINVFTLIVQKAIDEKALDELMQLKDDGQTALELLAKDFGSYKLVKTTIIRNLSAAILVKILNNSYLKNKDLKTFSKLIPAIMKKLIYDDQVELFQEILSKITLDNKTRLKLLKISKNRKITRALQLYHCKSIARKVLPYFMLLAATAVGIYSLTANQEE